MSADIEELIGRLEKAGPDHKLDQEIFAHHRGWSYPLYGAALQEFDELTREHGRTNYTGSIDAARTLLLPEHSFGGLAQVSPRDWIMMIFSRTDSRARWEGEASTAENAICIAALKALSATNTGK